MREQPLDVVDLERAPDALADLAGPHHEVLDEELAAPVEQVDEAHLAVGRVEDARELTRRAGSRGSSRFSVAL